MTKNSASTEKPPKAENSSSAQKTSSKKDATHNKVGLSDKQRLEIRDLFEDVYVENRKKIILTNFLRGIFFGLGTFIGGTIIVAIVVWILSNTLDIFPWASDFVNRILDSLQ